MFRYVWNGLCRTVRSRPQVAAQTSINDEDEQPLLEELIFVEDGSKYLSNFGGGTNYRRFRNDLLASASLVGVQCRQLSSASSSLYHGRYNLPRYNELPCPDLHCLLTKDEIESLIRGSSPIKSTNVKSKSIKRQVIVEGNKLLSPLKFVDQVHVETVINKQTENKQTERKAEPLKRVDTFQTLLSSVPVAKFVSSTQHCVAESHHVRGNEIMRAGKHEKAFRHFLLGSLQGCSKSQFNVALCYHFGTGTSVNLQQATRYYSMAAKQGHAHAQYNLALLLLNEGSPSVWKMARVQHLLLKSTEQGFAKSQCLLGTLVVDDDPVKAVQLFQQSSELLPLSKHHLAQCYQHGLGGLPVDGDKSLQLYTEAAEAGCLESQYRVAVTLWDGCKGVSQNRQLAVKMLKQAAGKGSRQAEEKLKQLKLK